MSTQKKTHYRKVFKSDHLSSYDLEDFLEQGLVLEFTIKDVKQFTETKVAGKSIAANIAYFTENIKPMVLNATNSKILSNLTGSSFVEDWKNFKVELYILKNIKFGNDKVEGIRIKETPPKALNEQDIKTLKIAISEIPSQSALNVFYSKLSPKEKTNKEVVEILKDMQIQLKQNA
jgi:hypothetical protein